MYNLDVAEYELNNPMALYGAIPYIVGHKWKSWKICKFIWKIYLEFFHSSARTVGVLWLNAAETWIDIKNSVADKVCDSKKIFPSIFDRNFF